MPIHLLNRFKKAALVAMLLSAGAANASLLDFKLTGDYTAEWKLDSTVSPDFVDSRYYFIVDSVPITYSNSSSAPADIYFYSKSLFGGLGIQDVGTGRNLLVTDGVQLYTGTESAPVFKTGAFSLTQTGGAGKYTLTVSDAVPTSDVPEPATVALLLGGLGLMGALGKRRQGR